MLTRVSITPLAASIRHFKGRIIGAIYDPSSEHEVLQILILWRRYCAEDDDWKKISESLDDAYEVNFGYGVLASDPHYLAVQLKTDQGPMGTKNYRILLEAIPLPNNQTFLHFNYSYDYGFAGGLALKTYLATIGSRKVGFTLDADTVHPGYIGGMRGMVERNTMRYYLAINSYLGALAVAPDKQLNKRLQDLNTATERYARQLYEITRNAYIAMKYEEVKRMVSM